MPFCKSADDTWNQLLAPTLMGAAGTGLASGFLSSQNDNPDETPSERRSRIIRSALLGAGVGGLAGAAVPYGMKMLNSRVEPAPKSTLSSVTDTLRENPGKTLAGVGGLGAAAMALRRGKIAPALLTAMRKGPFQDAAQETFKATVKKPSAIKELHEAMVAGMPGGPLAAAHNNVQAAEILRRAGGSHATTTGSRQLLPSLKEFLQNPETSHWWERKLGERMSVPSVGPAGPPSRTDRLAQWYSRIVQPSLRKTDYRRSNLVRPFVSTPGRILAGTAGGGALGAAAGEFIPGLGAE
jgi:hypothetical protein